MSYILLWDSQSCRCHLEMLILLHVCVSSSHALTSDVTIKDTARAAEFFLSDGLIITGAATGDQADPCDLRGTGALCSAERSCNMKAKYEQLCFRHSHYLE
ncbi:hypothetical protein ATANTOWER_027288 [Ataeniobius toweri]|uniref:Uncharacterized protein n=1 Tax=Ataeniobius toweri TaxID=208326 RepID=A0ABU7B278_9TELE|nr:hypothetical protein [Ataeniobius toweri]